MNELIDVFKEQNQMLASLLGDKQKAVAADHTGTLLHGPGGLFNTPGLSQALISLHVHAFGLGQLLPAFPSNETHPWFGFLTGFGGEIGDEPTHPCDPAPTGYMKSGTLTAKFGHYARDTNTIRLPDVIKKLNRSDFTDLRLANQILNPDSSGVYYPTDINESNILDMVVKAEQVIVGINLERKGSNLLWDGQGDGSNDTLDGYQEYPGLNDQIATGQVDAQTGAVMPSADSLVRSFAYQSVGAANIVGTIQEMESYMFQLAMDTQIGPVEWVLVMRPDLWEALSNVWPVQYNTAPDYQIIAGSEIRITLDGRENVSERDNYRSGMYLPINGRRYSVVVDNMIAREDIGSGVGLGVDEFASDIYFIPLRVVGGLPVTYWEYLDHNLSVPQTSLLHGMELWWTDAGRFLWSFDGKHTCFLLKAEVDPRVVLRTPHLAWRLQDVMYTNSTPPRDPDPDSDYWKDGGVSLRTVGGPTRYAAWL